jgi:hypothetical protein
MVKQIAVSVDVFAAIWAARLQEENSENEILTRILGLRPMVPERDFRQGPNDLPKSKKWTDLLVWTLTKLGGKATLHEIYKKSREGRKALGYNITVEHDASARECLESHCSDSHKYRHRADLFYMPEGKGAGVWALR